MITLTRDEIETPGVYVAFDKHGFVLYIGSSVHPHLRLAAHKNSSAWWDQMDRIEIYPYPSITQAKRVESRWIVSILPPFNITYASRRRWQQNPHLHRVIIEGKELIAAKQPVVDVTHLQEGVDEAQRYLDHVRSSQEG